MPSNCIRKAASTSPTPNTPKTSKAPSSGVVKNTPSASVSQTGSNRPSSPKTLVGAVSKGKNQKAVAPTSSSAESTDKEKSDNEESVATSRRRRTIGPKPDYREVNENADVVVKKKTVGPKKRQQPPIPKQLERLCKRANYSTEERVEMSESTGTRKTGPQPIPNEFTNGPCEVPIVICDLVQLDFYKITRAFNIAVTQCETGPGFAQSLVTAKATLIELMRKMIENLKERFDTQSKIRKNGLDVENCSSDWNETDAGMDVKEKYTGRMELAHFKVTIKFLELFISKIEDESWDGDLFKLEREHYYRKNYDHLFAEVNYSRHRINLLDVAEHGPGYPFSYEKVKDMINGMETTTEFRKLLKGAGNHHKRLEKLFRPTRWTAAKVIEDALKYAKRTYFPKGKHYHQLISNVLDNISYNVSKEEWEVKTYQYDNLFRGTDYTYADLMKSEQK